MAKFFDEGILPDAISVVVQYPLHTCVVKQGHPKLLRVLYLLLSTLQHHICIRNVHCVKLWHFRMTMGHAVENQRRPICNPRMTVSYVRWAIWLLCKRFYFDCLCILQINGFQFVSSSLSPISEVGRTTQVPGALFFRKKEVIIIFYEVIDFYIISVNLPWGSITIFTQRAMNHVITQRG